MAVVTALPAWASPAPDAPAAARDLAPLSAPGSAATVGQFAQATPPARPAPRRTAPPARVAQATPVLPADAAAARVRASLAELSRLNREMRTLKPAYEAQLKAVDRLKSARPWRRDNQIRSQLKKAQAIAVRLGVLSRHARVVRARVRTARVALTAAIRVEFRARPSTARRAQLARMRRANRRALQRHSRKIVLPDARIDPLADPEDLDDQAARILQAEKRLAAEIASLDTRAKRYQRMVKLRRTRQRAADLGGLDDNRPRRTTGRLTTSGDRDNGANGFGASSDDQGGAPAPSESGPGADPSALDSDPVVVLADVVDSQTLDELRRAESPTDPAIKAKAAARARGQVKARLQLLKRRLLIQRRAKQLRKR